VLVRRRVHRRGAGRSGAAANDGDASLLCVFFKHHTSIHFDQIRADNETVVGNSYLRLCDSAEYALNAIQEEMMTHGTLGAAFVSNNCGLDGSYGAYQFEIGRW
jgi:hypothetical protein